MTPFLPVTDTASSSSFMNCLLSSLHFILWDSWLHLWEFWTYGEISNLQTVLCGLSKFLQSISILFNIFFFLVLLQLSCIQLLYPAVPPNLSRLCVSHVSGTHCTWWGHILLSASQSAVSTEKWGLRTTVQMPRPLLEGERKHSRGSTLGCGTAYLPRKGVHKSVVLIATKIIFKLRSFKHLLQLIELSVSIWHFVSPNWMKRN